MLFFKTSFSEGRTLELISLPAKKIPLTKVFLKNRKAKTFAVFS